MKQSRRNLRNAIARAEARKGTPPVSRYARKQARIFGREAADAEASKLRVTDRRAIDTPNPEPSDG